ncbi:MAG: LptF/LptG family permease [Kiritimatiellae bacterium]|nr:LptF/LptG family permease [Kiritimatiellia bacterium]
MTILNRYFGRNYLITFMVTVAVFSFIMSIGSVIQAIDLLSRGVSGMVMLKFFLHSFPYILQFTVPISAMITAYLISSRLSMDGEINALKACGVNLWQVVAPIILLSVAISFLAMYVANFVSPRSKHAQRRLTMQMADHDPVGLLDEGRYVKEFPGHMIYIGKRRGNDIEDVSIYVVDEENDNQMEMNLRARTGRITMEAETKELLIDLYDVRIERPDPNFPLDLGRVRTMSAKHYPKRINLSELYRSGTEKKPPKPSDQTLFQLVENIRSMPPSRMSGRSLFRRLSLATDEERVAAKSLQEADERLPLLEKALKDIRAEAQRIRTELASLDDPLMEQGPDAGAEQSNGSPALENPEPPITDPIRHNPERADLEKALAAVQQRESELQRDMETARSEVARINRRYSATRKEADELRREVSIALDRMKILTETNSRMALSLSCFAFTLIGVPLGLQSKRKESASGVVICLLIMFVFYGFLALSKPLSRTPYFRPDLLIWIPVFFAEAIGLLLIHRSR